MATSLPRGFKAEAERRALTIRADLNLGLMDRLCCFALAEHLGVQVASLNDLLADDTSPESVARLTRPESPFSAMTICFGGDHLVVYNHCHPPGRQANSIVHELGHILLKHPQMPAMGVGGCRIVLVVLANMGCQRR
jgi:hypothetical protein